ncbi:uncharacterized protein [Choristoneura fumiferana]|uniref:uncharacterized protein n=1 Tax=Choristoneura fumiferana TaxID=7141 RepID=UPI003D155584
MICSQCQQILRITDGLKCSKCETRYHIKCADEATKECRDGGDRGYQWKCAVCQHSPGHSGPGKKSSGKETSMLNAINMITDKFEVVNKIQLPKLNNDLIEIKTAAERLVKQNEEILKQIAEINNRTLENEKKRVHTFRKRHLKLKSVNKKKELAAGSPTPTLPVNPVTDKITSYRPRRRSDMLHKMLIILNKKVSRSKQGGIISQRCDPVPVPVSNKPSK